MRAFRCWKFSAHDHRRLSLLVRLLPRARLACRALDRGRPQPLPMAEASARQSRALSRRLLGCLVARAWSPAPSRGIATIAATALWSSGRARGNDPARHSFDVLAQNFFLKAFHDLPRPNFERRLKIFHVRRAKRIETFLQKIQQALPKSFRERRIV